MKQHENYTLITGGTEGIGHELAKIFAENGHNLIIVARDEAELGVTKTKLCASNVDVISICKDLFDPAAAFEIHEEIKKRNITVDILVNNAGQGEYGLFADTNIPGASDRPVEY